MKDYVAAVATSLLAMPLVPNHLVLWALAMVLGPVIILPLDRGCADRAD